MMRKFYHQKLSDYDDKPICSLCDSFSLYYCTINDQYYCENHILGHDENELPHNFLISKTYLNYDRD